MYFRSLTLGGITQGEFAALCGVSRVSVNQWIAGARKPIPSHKAKATDLLQKIFKEHEAGNLPLSRSIRGPEARLKALRGLLTPTAV